MSCFTFETFLVLNSATKSCWIKHNVLCVAFLHELFLSFSYMQRTHWKYCFVASVSGCYCQAYDVSNTVQFSCVICVKEIIWFLAVRLGQWWWMWMYWFTLNESKRNSALKKRFTELRDLLSLELVRGAEWDGLDMLNIKMQWLNYSKVGSDGILLRRNSCGSFHHVADISCRQISS